MKARAFDAIDLGGGRRRGEIDARFNGVANSGQPEQPAFVHVCDNEKCVSVQYVTIAVCMCLPGPVNKLHICDT